MGKVDLNKLIYQRKKDKKRLDKLVEEIGCFKDQNLLIGFIHGMELGINDLEKIKSSKIHY